MAVFPYQVNFACANLDTCLVQLTWQTISQNRRSPRIQNATSEIHLTLALSLHYLSSLCSGFDNQSPIALRLFILLRLFAFLRLRFLTLRLLVLRLLLLARQLLSLWLLVLAL